MTTNQQMRDMGMNFEEPVAATLARISEQIANLNKKFDEHLAADQRKSDKIDDQIGKHEAALNQAIGGKAVAMAVCGAIGGAIVAIIELFRKQ